MKQYIPTPIDLSDVVLAEDLNELLEAMAENAHDVWAVERQSFAFLVTDLFAIVVPPFVSNLMVYLLTPPPPPVLPV